jgi:Pyruvate/2-oxoacid:ferredoxin oxidoreductase delta subunit
VNKSLLIYYFSGTGNAKSVADWIGGDAAKRSWNVEITNVAAIDRRKVLTPVQNTMIGFVAPTHGFNLPPIMMYFIFHFPRASSGNRVFVLNTRGGTRFGSIFLPGLSGIALWLPALVLWVKGYRIIGLRSIDLPSNWISIHPGLKDDAVISIYRRCRQKTHQFAGDILNNRRNFRAVFDIVQDCLITPVSLLYFLMGRFVLAKSFYAGSRCTNCRQCLRNCPVDAITTVSGQPYWTFRCESCMRCMNECPVRAIETGHGYLVGTLLLVNSWVLVTLWASISPLVRFDSYPAGIPIIRFIVDGGFTLILLMIAYRIVHFLKRVVLLRQIIEYTSLTRYSFWRRYDIRKLNLPGGADD